MAVPLETDILKSPEELKRALVPLTSRLLVGLETPIPKFPDMYAFP
jgi:hypothetical protein